MYARRVFDARGIVKWRHREFRPERVDRRYLG
jgi:hypothetical protein